MKTAIFVLLITISSLSFASEEFLIEGRSSMSIDSYLSQFHNLSFHKENMVPLAKKDAVTKAEEVCDGEIIKVSKWEASAGVTSNQYLPIELHKVWGRAKAFFACD